MRAVPCPRLATYYVYVPFLNLSPMKVGALQDCLHTNTVRHVFALCAPVLRKDRGPRI
jgi:hypothetical protein